MGKESFINGSWEARQALLFGNGRAVKPDELHEFIEGVVEAGGTIDPHALASELGCSAGHLIARLDTHQFTERFEGRNGEVCFLSKLTPPSFSQEGISALHDIRDLDEDRLGREATADFYSLVAERSLMSSQRKRGRTRVIRRF